MITGVVNTDLEATLRLRVSGGSGLSLDVMVVIDTGYDGALSLPLAAIQTLSLPPPTSGQVTLADNSRRIVNFYDAEMLWDGQRRPVRDLCVEADPVVGTALLKGYKLDADFVDGGPVVLRALP
jgi:clan AA aspartic protease